jgi:DNA-binding winged helix-turn-helix (wHTH) protein
MMHSDCPPLYQHHPMARRRRPSPDYTPTTVSILPEHLVFGPFSFLPRQRLLLEEGEPVPVGSRALDILIALIERPGELIAKNALVARVWPDTIVTADNLRVQVAALRRSLHDGSPGHRYILTVPGRGYSFVGGVRTPESIDRADRYCTSARRTGSVESRRYDSGAGLGRSIEPGHDSLELCCRCSRWSLACGLGLLDGPLVSDG